jgi:diguanylate cyclase (GGDEF)-like protein
VDSHLEYKEALRDVQGERRLDVDVVETYVPIRAEGSVVGAFEVYLDVTRYRQAIRTGVTTTMLVLTGILLLVFGASLVYVWGATRRLAAAQERLREMATIDALTGALNRGTILARAREEISRAERLRGENPDYGLGFILLDIDYFKRINDTYGHLTGDQVLRELAEQAREVLRDYDIFGRYGGEEFLVILPDSSAAGALAAAERIRQAVREHSFVFAEPLLKVTVSLGVTTVLPGEQDLSQMLKRADDALYCAKDAGRDRVVMADGAEPEA